MEVKSNETVLMNYKVEKVGISVRAKSNTRADPHPNVISFGIYFEKTVYYNLSYFIYGVSLGSPQNVWHSLEPRQKLRKVKKCAGAQMSDYTLLSEHI